MLWRFTSAETTPSNPADDPEAAGRLAWPGRCPFYWVAGTGFEVNSASPVPVDPHDQPPVRPLRFLCTASV